jgi:sialate O-acetylesterase
MHKKMLVVLMTALSLFCLDGQGAWAAVKPHGLFSDGMVLQQGMKVPIWGTAGPNEQVRVDFQGQHVTTSAKDGHWLLRLENLKPGGPFEMTIRGSNTLRFNNVLVGEVWICSGQSNMEWPVSMSADAKRAMAASKNPIIRLLRVPRHTALSPRHDLKADWKECGPDTVRDFTAVGYFFGRDLQKALGVPVGLIQSAWGGTLAEAWTSQGGLKHHPDFKNVADWDTRAQEKYVRAKKAYEETLARHEKAVAQAKQDGKQPPKTPRPPNDPAHDPSRPAALYNGMIAPLIPYAIRGAIWYQGESNVSRAYQYRTLFPLMIENWRHNWGEGAFPFLFVQLAPFLRIVKEPQESSWAELREAQLLTSLQVPHTAMAVITDVGAEKDIHPRHKEPVGGRLALAALAVAYGRPIVYSGPIYDHMKVEGDRIVLSFKDVGSGLVAKNGSLQGFVIAGDDHKFVNAQAEIRGAEVAVWSMQVPKPVAVRYGWANYPLGNLWNREGLPASPFRTDDFPATTAPAHSTGNLSNVP